LRNFLHGLIIYLRGSKEEPKEPWMALKEKPVATNKKSAN